MKGSFRRFDVVGQLPALRRFARALTRDETDAEDLVQDALVRAYAARDTFRAGGNLRAWLMSIVHNTFISDRRRSAAEQRRVDEAGTVAPESAEPSQDYAVRLAQIRHAFDGLPEEQRAALHLVAVEGASYQEAAATLGIPIGTLMSRLGRARAALRAFEAGTAPASHAGISRNNTRLRIVGGSDDAVD